MLKALELLGFKSFADKTRFEFPDGITVVVGPNGSGKSNIVDAIKWVLGERSAKSLRGKEMADVIFKGSGSGGRKAMNTAEASIIFNNADGRLPVDAPEVHVTRRVYRSGEGEYLMNGQACRLRDLKDMFRGTGVGTDAYSVIEQGKVDTLLSATPRDRRAIFEEAAGISRFKAKKLESQRRLERVEQNLLRLSDIVDEVEGRLRGIRAQATKARRYKEHSDRLQQLRTQVGLADWRELTRRLEALDDELVQLRDRIGRHGEEIEQYNATAAEIDGHVAVITDQTRTVENRMSRGREQTAAAESTIEHQHVRRRDLEDETAGHRAKLAATRSRAGDLRAELDETGRSLADAETAFQTVSAELATHEQHAQRLREEIGALREENDVARRKYVDQMRAVAALGNQTSAVESELAGSKRTAKLSEEKLARLAEAGGPLAEKLQRLQQRETQLAKHKQQKADALAVARAEKEETQRRLAQRRDEAAQLRGEAAGVEQRILVLEDLEGRFEGIGEGAKELLARSRVEPDGPLGDVRGLVADLIQVNVENAPSIDVALGDMAGYVVLSGTRLLEQLRDGTRRLEGRVGLLPLFAPSAKTDGQNAKLDGRPGVVGRADRFVQVAPEFTPLVRRLLDTTWLVESLDRAVELKETLGRDLRFVTSAGDLIRPDGAIVVGPRHGATGLISRRSQLHALRVRRGELTGQVESIESRIGELQQLGARQGHAVAKLDKEHGELSSALSEQRVAAGTTQEQLEQNGRQADAIEAERRAACEQSDAAEETLASMRERQARLEAALADMESETQAREERIGQLERKFAHANQQATDGKVRMAASRQRLEGLQTQMLRFREHEHERSRAIEAAGGELRQCLAKRQLAERLILAASSRVASLYIEQERNAAELAGLVDRRDRLIRDRASAVDGAQSTARQVQQLQEQVHEKELAAGEVRHQRSTLAERVREDYGIDLAQLEEAPSEEEQQRREEVDREIAELRRKLSNIGAVNMEALDELEGLESRFAALSGQHQDLSTAKASLEKIIQRINADSRRLFSETLDAIRSNFQTLFRKVFGGGQADIVLEEGVDALEAGIEILATPPGKHSLGISLLSGGERALTAVTLLLAIFQYRPSPFCVLDEVDGPLDEANIGRFIDVLNEFLAWTKFVVVTHSKKTMTAATTLYGITMQESGVSKRVSVRFEDVSEDGHIRREALEDPEDAASESELGAA